MRTLGYPIPGCIYGYMQRYVLQTLLLQHHTTQLLAHKGIFELLLLSGIPHILDDLQMVKPTLLYAVPTLYKRVHDGVINTMNNASPIQQTLMRSALRLGRANAAHKNELVNEDSGELAPPLGLVDRFKYKILDDVVLAKIRDRFGGNLRAG